MSLKEQIADQIRPLMNDYEDDCGVPEDVAGKILELLPTPQGVARALKRQRGGYDVPVSALAAAMKRGDV